MKHEQKSVVMDGDTAAAYISYAFFHHAEKAIATCKCQVFNGGELAAETDVTIAMR